MCCSAARYWGFRIMKSWITTLYAVLIFFVWKSLFELVSGCRIGGKITLFQQNYAIRSDCFRFVDDPIFLSSCRNSDFLWFDPTLKNEPVFLILDWTRLRSIRKGFLEKRGQINSFSDLFIFVHASRILISLGWPLNKHVPLRLVKTIHDVLNDIAGILIWVIRVSNSVKADSPLTSNILHLEPCRISIVKSWRYFYPVTSAINRLIVWPVSSKFNDWFFLEELNIASFIKVLWRKD